MRKSKTARPGTATSDDSRTHADIAEEAGIEQSYLSLIENGRKASDTRRKLAKVLNVPADPLLPG